MRPERLIPILLGSALLVPLTWCLVRADRDVSPGRTRGVPRAGETSRPSRTPAVAREKAARKSARKAAEKASEPGGRSEDLGRPTGPSPSLLLVPVEGVDRGALQGTFSQSRGATRSHGALDILAPRGTPVLAAGDGIVKKLFTSVRGGLTVYQFDLEERYCYYYAHLDAYAPGLHEGQLLRRGDQVGTVGSTGNARTDAPHLHFAVNRLDPDKKWWGGTPIDPYPLLVRVP